jgi:hypothetical protein
MTLKVWPGRVVPIGRFAVSFFSSYPVCVCGVRGGVCVCVRFVGGESMTDVGEYCPLSLVAGAAEDWSLWERRRVRNGEEPGSEGMM